MNNNNKLWIVFYKNNTGETRTLTYITQHVLSFIDFGERLQNDRLKEAGYVFNFASDVMHHCKDTVIHKFAVIFEFSKQQTIMVHNFDRWESKKKNVHLKQFWHFTHIYCSICSIKLIFPFELFNLAASSSKTNSKWLATIKSSKYFLFCNTGL